MRIGLDIDNVISDFDKKLYEEFLKEDKKKRNNGIVNPDGNWIKDLFDWSTDEVNEFFNNNMEKFASSFELIKDAKKYMDKLLEEGHKLYLISHRSEPHYKNPYEVTVKWLKENDINYTELILSKSTNKSEECKLYNIDIMFDDSRINCHNLIESGINTYLVATKYNLKNLQGLRVVNNWKEIYELIKSQSKKKVILDTDMYNEVDDRFALTYLMNSLDVFDVEAITIAPFSKSGYAANLTIEEGTNVSYKTTLDILDMLGKSEYKNKVYKGAIKYMKDSEEENEAIKTIVKIAKKNEKTTILAIGAITNVAIAIKKHPEIINKIKVVWLGGNSFLTKNNDEFNFRQDIPAVQTVFNSGVELVVIPCRNVASNLSTTIYELRHYLSEETEINNYLLKAFEECKKAFIKSPIDAIGSSKTLWDLSVIAYEINSDWFKSEYISCPKVLDNGKYEQTTDNHKVIFITDLFRNKIYQDYFIKMGR